MQPVKEVGIEPKVDMKIPVATSEEYDINCSLCTFNSCNVVRKCTQLMLKAKVRQTSALARLLISISRQTTLAESHVANNNLGCVH